MTTAVTLLASANCRLMPNTPSFRSPNIFLDYAPAARDFYKLNLPGTNIYLLDRDFAGGLFYTICFVTLAILCTAHSNALDLTQPLPVMLPARALEEIVMPPPPMLPMTVFALNNPLAAPASIESLCELIHTLQTYAKMGLQWIATAKACTYTLNSQTRWVWDNEPTLSLPTVINRPSSGLIAPPPTCTTSPQQQETQDPQRGRTNPGMFVL